MGNKSFRKLGLSFCVLLFLLGFGLFFTSCTTTGKSKPGSSPSQAVGSQGQSGTEKELPQKKPGSGG